MINKIEISKIVFLIFHERLFQKKLKFIFLKRYRPGLFYSIYHFVLSHLVTEKIKKMIDKIEISKIVFLIFHERLFQKKLKFIFLKRYRQGLFYSIYHFVLSHLVTEKIKKMIDKIEISKIVFLIFHERLFQKKLKFIFLKRYRPGLFYSIYHFVLSHLVTEKIKKMIDKIEISKIVFLIFHERLFQKKLKFIFLKRYRPGLFNIYHFVLSHLVTEKIKKIDWQNWNFQNCFPHISWTPVPKKIKIYIFEKISSRTILQYLPFCSISFGYGENKKNDWQNWNFQNCFPHISWTPVPKKIKIYIFEKISSWTILQYIPFCCISFGYGENKKKWLTKLKFPKLFSSYFMNACSKKIKIYIFEKISSRTILQYLPFCAISFGYGENKKNDWQNWNFQNCFPHISWTPVPKKLKFIFLKRYRLGLFYSNYHFVLSHLVMEKIKKKFDKIEISKIVFLIFHERLFQ